MNIMNDLVLQHLNTPDLSKELCILIYLFINMA